MLPVWFFSQFSADNPCPCKAIVFGPDTDGDLGRALPLQKHPEKSSVDNQSTSDTTEKYKEAGITYTDRGV